MTTRPPIIIVGMHRSGTSMIVRALARLGLFTGWRLDANDEPFFFVRLNEWMLSQTGCRWDRPPRPGEWPAVHDMAEILEESLRSALSGLRSVEYWGPRRIVSGRDPHAQAAPWGWKDPRNTVTLPLWLRIFPDAKVVHIRRHGLDVACSLKARNDMLTAEWKAANRLSPYRLAAMRELWLSECCNSITGAVNLWDNYLKHAEIHMQRLGDRCIDLKYEAFLERPEIELARLAEFCSLPRNQEAIGRIGSSVDRGRAYAYRRNAELASSEPALAASLSAHGY